MKEGRTQEYEEERKKKNTERRTQGTQKVEVKGKERKEAARNTGASRFDLIFNFPNRIIRTMAMAGAKVGWIITLSASRIFYLAMSQPNACKAVLEKPIHY